MLYDTNIPGRWYRPTLMDTAPQGVAQGYYDQMNTPYNYSASYVPQYYQGTFNVPEPTYALLDDTPGIPQFDGGDSATGDAGGGSDTPIADRIPGDLSGWTNDRDGRLGGSAEVGDGPGYGHRGFGSGSTGGLGLGYESLGEVGGLLGMGLGAPLGLGIAGNLLEAKFAADDFGVPMSWGAGIKGAFNPFGIFGETPTQNAARRGILGMTIDRAMDISPQQGMGSLLDRQRAQAAANARSRAGRMDMSDRSFDGGRDRDGNERGDRGIGAAASGDRGDGLRG